MVIPIYWQLMVVHWLLTKSVKLQFEIHRILLSLFANCFMFLLPREIYYLWIGFVLIMVFTLFLIKVQPRYPVNHDVLLEGKAKGGLYELLLYLNKEGVALSCVTLPYNIWHSCLGHLNLAYMSIMFKKGLIKSVSPNKCKLCESCFAGKSHASPHPSHRTCYSPLELVFEDIWGSSPIISH